MIKLDEKKRNVNLAITSDIYIYNIFITYDIYIYLPVKI